MGKIKSAICLTLITLVIAVLCVVCFVPFPTDSDGIHFFSPIFSWLEKSADFGEYVYVGSEAGADSDNYIGGGFSVVFYPEGVISAKEYRDDLAAKEGEERTEYEEKYVSYANGAIYLDATLLGEDGKPGEEFVSGFETQVKILRERFERLHQDDMTLSVADEFTVRATLPQSSEISVAAFLYSSYMGELKVLYGTSQTASDATQVLPAPGKNSKPITDYIKSISTRTAAGNAYVIIRFTEEGLKLISSATSGAADSSGTLFFQVGDNSVISLSISEQIHDDLYISGSYTSESAALVCGTLDTAMKYGTDLGMKMGELYRTPATFASAGKLGAYSLALIAYGACALAATAFFFVRYRRLAFAHLYSFLVFILALGLCFWAIPVPIGAGSIAALAITSALLFVSNAISYEYARKEYALGKTIVSSVKTGYKKCFWHLFDLHIVLAIAGLLTWLIALTELGTFALAFLLGVVFSGLCSLLVNRFMWYIMMPFAKNGGKFCHFKREEVEDDD